MLQSSSEFNPPNETDPSARLQEAERAELLSLDGYAFIRRAYWLALGREPDPGGLANYLAQLRSGTPKQQVLQELAGSPEGKAKEGGLPGDLISAARFAPAVEQLEASKVSSWDHLAGTHGQAFLRSAYQTLLGRDPDPQGLRFYLGQLRSGISRVEILAQLRHSRECKGRLQGQSKSALLRRVDWEIAKFWLARVPLLGWFLRAVLGIEGNGPTDMRLRRMEYLLFCLTAGEADDFIEPPSAVPSDQSQVDKTSAGPPQGDTNPVQPSTVDTSRPAALPAAASLRSLSVPANWGRENDNG